MPEILENTSNETKPDKLGREETKRLFGGRMGVKSFSLTGLFVLACLCSLYVAREFLIPIVLAIVFTFLFNPVVRALNRLRIPLFAASAVVIVGFFACIVLMFYELSGPLADWMDRIPEISAKLNQQLDHFKSPVQKVTQATEQVRDLADGSANRKAPQQVELKKPSALSGLFSKTYSFAFGLLEMVILLYFLLGSGDMFLRKLIHVLPRLEDKKRAAQIAREIEDSISRYLLTVAMINAGLGAAAALVFWALGVPNPMLWGAVGCILNFIPYVGALTTIGIVTLIATATFPTLGHALTVPASYLGLALVEGSIITPWIVGRRMTLNPVVILAGLAFWSWMWGIVGALLAVPMLVMLKILCDHIEPLAPIGEFLGQ